VTTPDDKIRLPHKQGRLTVRQYALELLERAAQSKTHARRGVIPLRHKEWCALRAIVDLLPHVSARIPRAEVRRSLQPEGPE